MIRGYEYICFVCNQIVNDGDDYEWFGMDGDKIHKKCKPNVNKAMDLINNMTDEQFSKWILGKHISGKEQTE